jgi:hypothetical protein
VVDHTEPAFVPGTDPVRSRKAVERML